MAKIKGTIRRSQLITTYGVGALVAVEDESFMVVGIDRWDVTQPGQGLLIHEPRLERELNVGSFALPPATDHDPDVPVIRFPKWYSCPTCNRLDEHKFFTTFDRNDCPKCGGPLVPSRFVICCDRGHIDDFPYFRWLHGGQEPSGTNKHEMTIEAAGRTASLKDIVLSCSCGVPSTSMDGAFSKSALRDITKCQGHRPWLRGPDEPCSEVPRALQRGASNVWFPIVRSALSIPPWSEGAYKVLNRQWNVLKHIPDDALAPTIVGMGLAEGSAFSVDDLVLAVLQRKGREAAPEQETNTSLKEQEYEALVRGKDEVTRAQDFVCVPVARLESPAADWFEQVMLVKRLREVRVLEGFTRILPPTPGDRPERRASLFDTPTDWLPAVEVTGEGVFLRLDSDRLQCWETTPMVINRIKAIDLNYKRRFADVGAVADRNITPRLVLIHTLAHVLISQWSLDSGYPAASLRERLYASETMAGLLIYTATTDSAGSLGGVVGQATPERLGPTLLEAVARASWCSADPLCVEADASGVDALNLAACHACVLLPETSCEEMNLLLDRAVLIGTPDEPAIGFFTDLLGDA